MEEKQGVVYGYIAVHTANYHDDERNTDTQYPAYEFVFVDPLYKKEVRVDIKIPKDKKMVDLIALNLDKK